MIEKLFFPAFGNILVLVVAFPIKILIKKYIIEQLIFPAFGNILVLVVSFPN